MTPVTILRLFNGVFLNLVAFVSIGVTVVFGKIISDSESEFSKFWRVVGFLTAGYQVLNFFWFSAEILFRQDTTSFPGDDFNSSSSSVWILGDLIGPATQFCA